MIVFHGSEDNTLDTLEPQYYGGRNGSMSGVGNNATTSLQRATQYAGEEGSVYALDMDVSRFLMISDEHRLTPTQAQSLLDSVNQLPLADQTRLYTDLLGKQTLVFKDDVDALSAYKKHKAHFQELGLSHDRLKPSYEFEAEHVEVFVARTKAEASELTQVPTSHLHYILALYDNAFVTDALKRFAEGLIMPRDHDTTLLSFRQRDPIQSQMPVTQLTKEARALPANVIASIGEHCHFFFAEPRGGDTMERAAPLFEALGITDSLERLQHLSEEATPTDALNALLTVSPPTPTPAQPINTDSVERAMSERPKFR